MKISLSIIYFLLVSFIGTTQENYYSHARNGLYLREAPNKKTDNDTIIPYGSVVTIINKSDSIFHINGLLGSWAKIKFGDKIGFAFSAYLSTHSVTINNDKHNYLKDYAFDHFVLTEGNENFKMTDWLVESKVSIFGEVRYQCTEEGSCNLDERLYLPGMTIQEGLMIFSAFIKGYGDYTFKRSRFSYNKESKAYEYAYTKHHKNSFSQNYFIAYTLNEDGSYKYMSIDFDWEGGGGTLSVYQFNDRLICVEHTYSCH